MVGKTLVLNLKDPADLGMGGMMLQWNTFSKETPVAVMKLTSREEAEFHWLGFYDEKTEVKTWVGEPDFLAVENDLFLKCKEQ